MKLTKFNAHNIPPQGKNISTHKKTLLFFLKNESIKYTTVQLKITHGNIWILVVNPISPRIKFIRLNGSLHAVKMITGVDIIQMYMYKVIPKTIQSTFFKKLLINITN